ncbi:MAG: serine/threonine protein kinase, partial [Planctomycetaceae bacterium]|nr:serine/threonine protein kinase [Planctomycetaceae bacterium]
ETGIAWKSDLPATSISSPIVAGERAFVMAEPNRLLCFRLTDGELLWNRPHEYEVIFGLEKANEIKQLHAESQKVQQEIAELEKQLKSEEDANPNSEKVTSLRDRIKKLQQRDEELTAIPPPRTDATGNTASTPVADLENVYAVLGNGIVSSHTLDGQRNWSKFISKPMSRHSASPIIAGNLLIVHLKELFALDRRSGEIVWKTAAPARNGTPVALKVGDKNVIVTPAGAIIGGEDGKVLAKDLFDLGYSSPIAHQGVIFAAERGRFLAIKLSLNQEESNVQADVIWQTKGAQEDRLASPVIHEGLLFSSTGSGILDVVDIATGNVIKRKRLELGEGRVDASLSLANDHLYVQSTNGTTVILKPTADCPEIARNKAEGSSSSPFFVDKRIVFRTPTHVICIAAQKSKQQ